MLAYVFWHRSTADRAAYEEALRGFHAALAAAPPPGYAGSVAVRLDAAPWLPGQGTAYEDWYLVDGWASLGTLNEAAVTGPRRAPHGAAAAGTRQGAAGIYAPVSGPATPPTSPRGAWLAKPPGTPYEEWQATLAAGGGAVWQRQMTLGPPAEFVVFGDAPGALDAVVVERAAVFGA